MFIKCVYFEEIVFVHLEWGSRIIPCALLVQCSCAVLLYLSAIAFRHALRAHVKISVDQRVRLLLIRYRLIVRGAVGVNHLATTNLGQGVNLGRPPP